MTTYEIVIACVALTNLSLTVFVLLSNRAKAGADKLAAVERALRADLKEQAQELQALQVVAQKALNEDHLKDVYTDLKAIAGQVNRMVGEQEQMNNLLRQLLSKQLGA